MNQIELVALCFNSFLCCQKITMEQTFQYYFRQIC